MSAGLLVSRPMWGKSGGCPLWRRLRRPLFIPLTKTSEPKGIRLRPYQERGTRTFLSMKPKCVEYVMKS
jgi:hypothetical protein